MDSSPNFRSLERWTSMVIRILLSLVGWSKPPKILLAVAEIVFGSRIRLQWRSLSSQSTSIKVKCSGILKSFSLDEMERCSSDICLKLIQVPSRPTLRPSWNRAKNILLSFSSLSLSHLSHLFSVSFFGGGLVFLFLSSLLFSLSLRRRMFNENDGAGRNVGIKPSVHAPDNNIGQFFRTSYGEERERERKERVPHLSQNGE